MHFFRKSHHARPFWPLLRFCYCPFNVAAVQVTWPTLTKAVSPEKSPGADGFIQRWLLLEPIPTTGLTEPPSKPPSTRNTFPTSSP